MCYDLQLMSTLLVGNSDRSNSPVHAHHAVRQIRTVDLIESLNIYLDIGLPIDTSQVTGRTLDDVQLGDTLVCPALSCLFNLLIILLERSARVGTARHVMTRLVDQVDLNLVVII